jgi:hypothetical protein
MIAHSLEFFVAALRVAGAKFIAAATAATILGSG